MDKQMIGMCGAYCGICEWRPKTDCPGCQAARGDMFFGECTVAKCCVDKGFTHCGECPDLPCTDLQATFDNPEHGDHGERLINLKTWANGEETYLKLRTLKKEDGQPDE